jgi:hypothetical protein
MEAAVTTDLDRLRNAQTRLMSLGWEAERLSATIRETLPAADPRLLSDLLQQLGAVDCELERIRAAILATS